MKYGWCAHICKCEPHSARHGSGTQPKQYVAVRADSQLDSCCCSRCRSCFDIWSECISVHAYDGSWILEVELLLVRVEVTDTDISITLTAFQALIAKIKMQRQ